MISEISSHVAGIARTHGVLNALKKVQSEPKAVLPANTTKSGWIILRLCVTSRPKKRKCRSTAPAAISSAGGG